MGTVLATPAVTSAGLASWSAAREESHALGVALSPLHARQEWIEVGAAEGHTVDQDLRSLVALPGFDAAAMDGWAVRDEGPWQVDAPILAGSVIPTEPLRAGRARPIATGAPLPPATTAVLRREFGEVHPAGLLHATTPVDPGADVRRAGEELRRGDRVLRAGDVVTPARMALLAAAGFDRIPTRSAPTVSFVVMGDEICRAGAPEPGMVRDVFGVALPALLTGAAVGTAAVVSCGDTLRETVRTLRTSLDESAVVITTGGSSHGPVDHARAALDELGARTVFDGVDMRPGHPVMLHATAGSAVLSLPGNPLAGFLSFLSFAAPLLAGLLGRPLPLLRRLPAAVPIENPRRSTRLVPCRWDRDGLRPVGWTGSGMLRGLADADVVAVVPGGGLAAGRPCDVLPTQATTL